MFGIWKRLEKLESYMKTLDERIEHVADKPIGEYYEFYEYSFGERAAIRSWILFRVIDDQVDNKVKIHGKWYDRSDVIIYADQWKAKKKRIEAKYGEQKKDS